MPDPKTLTGEITDIAFKPDKNGNEYVEVSLSQPGKQYATKCRAFDDGMVARFKKARKGMALGLVIEEEHGEYQGRSVTYRNIVGLTAAGTPLAAEGPPPPNGSPPRDQLGLRIAWAQAVNLGVEAMSEQHPQGYWQRLAADGIVVERRIAYLQDVEAMANLFYPLILAGPGQAAPVAQNEPQADPNGAYDTTQVDDEPLFPDSPQETPQATDGGMDRDQFWAAVKKAGYAQKAVLELFGNSIVTWFRENESRTWADAWAVVRKKMATGAAASNV